MKSLHFEDKTIDNWLLNAEKQVSAVVTKGICLAIN